MQRFWFLLLASKSLSFVTPFHLDNLIAVKIVKAVSFTGETQINRAFHTRRTNNALFAKSAFSFLSRNTGQCPVSSVLEQLLGVGVTTRRPFPSVTSSNYFLFGGRPTGLSTSLPSNNNPSAILVENFNRAI